MDNKSIVIDGVDVSECEAYKPYLGKYDCIALGNKSLATCKDSPNCYFKQLTRKTQECEELKLQLTSLSYADTICALEIDLEHKTQECEKLKLDLIEAKAHGDYLNNLALSETLNLVNEQLDQLEAENDQLKAAKEQAEQKLERIREVCKNGVYDKFNMPLDENSVILQIISEGYNSLAEDCTSELDTPSASRIIDEV